MLSFAVFAALCRVDMPEGTEGFREGYRRPGVVRALSEGKVHFAAETREARISGQPSQKLFLMELAGVTTANEDRIWAVLRNVAGYKKFLPFVDDIQPAQPLSLIPKLVPMKTSGPNRPTSGPQGASAGFNPPVPEQFYIRVSVWGYWAQMWVTVNACDKELAFRVDEGSFRHMVGRLRFEPWTGGSPAPASVSKRMLVMEAEWVTPEVSIPWIILKFGMEFSLQRMAKAFLREVNHP
jgi:hypothetical protein